MRRSIRARLHGLLPVQPQAIQGSVCQVDRLQLARQVSTMLMTRAQWRRWQQECLVASAKEEVMTSPLDGSRHSPVD